MASNKRKTNKSSVFNREESSKLYSDKELLLHIESVSKTFLYIFATLWGGLIYIIIDNQKNDYVKYFIDKLVIIGTNIPERWISHLAPQLIVIFVVGYMILVLSTLIATMSSRELNLNKKSAKALLSRKNSQLQQAILLGTIISILAVFFILLILINPPEATAQSYKIITTFLSEFLLVLALVLIPLIDCIEKNNLLYKEFIKVFEQQLKIERLHKYNDSSIYIGNLFRIIIRNVGKAIINSYMFVIGTFIFIIYILSIWFHIIITQSWVVFSLIISVLVFMTSFFVKSYSKKIIDLLVKVFALLQKK
jgi:hypothetical protein